MLFLGKTFVMKVYSFDTTLDVKSSVLESGTQTVEPRINASEESRFLIPGHSHRLHYKAKVNVNIKMSTKALFRKNIVPRNGRNP